MSGNIKYFIMKQVVFL